MSSAASPAQSTAHGPPFATSPPWPEWASRRYRESSTTRRMSPPRRANVSDGPSPALNFQPNQGAGALRRGDRKTLTIGLLLDAVDNPFSAAINRAVENVAVAARHRRVRRQLRRRPRARARLVEAFTRRRVDGLILTTYQPGPRLPAVETRAGHADRLRGPAADRAARRRRGQRQLRPPPAATRHLIWRGHRRIAHLGDELTISTARERRQRLRRRHGPSRPEPAAPCTSTTCAPSRRPTRRSGS